jgi:hypothetical protein
VSPPSASPWLLLLALMPACAHAQVYQPPVCVGPNVALQFGTAGWLCPVLQGTPGPPGPATPAQPSALSPTGGAAPCNVANWNGTAWSCVQTNYITAN